MTSDRLTAGAQRRLQGGLQIGPTAAARPMMAERLTRRADELEPAHQPLGDGQFVVAVLGEVLVPQHLYCRKAQGDRWVRLGLRGLVVISIVFIAVVIDGEGDAHGFFVGRCLGVDHCRQPERGERPIEHGDVFRGSHEGGTSRPVHLAAIVEPEAPEGVDEGEHAAERDPQPGTAQDAGEGDRHPLGRCGRQGELAGHEQGLNRPKDPARRPA